MKAFEYFFRYIILQAQMPLVKAVLESMGYAGELKCYPSPSLN